MNNRLKIVIFILSVVLLLGIILFIVYHASLSNNADLTLNEKSEENIYEDIKKANQEALEKREENSAESLEERQKFEEELNKIDQDLKELAENKIDAN